MLVCSESRQPTGHRRAPLLLRHAPVVAVALAVTLLTSGCGGSGDPTASSPVTSVQEPVATTSQGAAPYPVGLTTQRLDVDGVERSYLVHVPPDLVAPRALVLVLHGGGGEGAEATADGSKPLSVFRDIADREGFVVVYPEGSPSADAQERSGWVDCRADSDVRSGADDVGFLATLIERVGAEYGLGSDRVFMAGSSNGAMMSQAFALYHPDLVAAVASSAGNLAADPFPGVCTDGPDRPVPILLSHGTADVLMPFDGGCVADIGGTCRRGRVISADATVERWLQINGLTGVPPVSRNVEVDPGDSGSGTEFVYDGETPVHWWRFDGAGHAAPSTRVLLETNRLAGAQNRDVEFAEISWAFFASQLPDGG